MVKNIVKTKKLVSVIIPAYKQEKTIEKDLRNIYGVMSETRWDFEIIVVVDGMLDKTFENARRVNEKNVKVTGYETNHGKGYAVRYGMVRAKGDYIAFIDSGMEIQPNGISMLLEHMEWYNADIMLGSKRHPASKVNYPSFRRFYSFVYHAIVKVLFRIPVKDTQVGLKVFKRNVLEAVLPRLVIKQYAFDIELLAVAHRLGFKRIYEAPVYISIDFSSGTNFGRFLPFSRYIRKMLFDTLAVFYRMYFLRYYDDRSKQKWVYDKELDMKVNTGGLYDS
ncbi:glycosyltransferase [candidate division WWE3 bacterium]|uniref:Glycosyltransferase n=1 Tax=candidate division WWE3 bacterium TaxID=2053526 RepID=A0A7X9E715_UNCKA|nr:glycosyltransferase [candidate division WWE3 bacterium]